MRRVAKEIASYEKDAEKQEARAEQWAAEGREAHEVRKQREVAAESRDMIKDSRARLANSLTGLQDALDEFLNNGGDPDDAAVGLARTTLADHA